MGREPQLQQYQRTSIHVTQLTRGGNSEDGDSSEEADDVCIKLARWENVVVKVVGVVRERGPGTSQRFRKHLIYMIHGGILPGGQVHVLKLPRIGVTANPSGARLTPDCNRDD